MHGQKCLVGVMAILPVDNTLPICLVTSQYQLSFLDHGIKLVFSLCWIVFLIENNVPVHIGLYSALHQLLPLVDQIRLFFLIQESHWVLYLKE